MTFHLGNYMFTHIAGAWLMGDDGSQTLMIAQEWDLDCGGHMVQGQAIVSRNHCGHTHPLNEQISLSFLEYNQWQVLRPNCHVVKMGQS